MYDYACPWCGKEIDDHNLDTGPDTDYEVECPSCGRTFFVSYELVPRYSVTLPSEMSRCEGECGYYNIWDDCCGLDEYREKYGNDEGDIPGWCPMARGGE